MFVTDHELGIPDVSARKETTKWIREEFERNRHIRDTVRPQSFGCLQLDEIGGTGHY